MDITRIKSKDGTTEIAFSTPLMHELLNEAAANAIPATTLRKVEKLIAAAVRYVQGDRTQKDLFDGAEEGEAASE